MHSVNYNKIIKHDSDWIQMSQIYTFVCIIIFYY